MNSFINQKLSDLWDTHNCFFAFGEQQFCKELEKRNLSVNQITGISSGLYCPIEHSKIVMDEMIKIIDNSIEIDLNENGVQNIIRREYFNYETHISYDKSDLMDALKNYIQKFPELFTLEIINEEIKKCFQEAIEKDLF